MSSDRKPYILSVAAVTGLYLGDKHYPQGSHPVELTEAEAARANEKPGMKAKATADGARGFVAGDLVVVSEGQAKVLSFFDSVVRKAASFKESPPFTADTFVDLAGERFSAVFAAATEEQKSKESKGGARTGPPSAASATPATSDAASSAPVSTEAAPVPDTSDANPKSTHPSSEAEAAAARAGGKKAK